MHPSGLVRSAASKQKFEGVDRQIGFVDWLTADKNERHPSPLQICNEVEKYRHEIQCSPSTDGLSLGRKKRDRRCPDYGQETDDVCGKDVLRP
jgi:hypothetical protein